MPQTTNAQNKQPRKVKRRFSPQAAAILFGVIVIVAIIALISAKVNAWKNDGARYARSLSEQIGVSPETAEKYTKVELTGSSDYACVNAAAAAQEYSYLYESSKSVEVSGVSVPEWLIFARTVNNVITEVTYYDYTQLKTYGQGVETRGHVDAAMINTGMDSAAVQEYIGFAPLRTKYTSEGVVETYKYHYEDKESGNLVSYLLHVSYLNGKASAAAEEENQFVVSLLTVK
jgi:hypothetical protein